MITSIVSCAPGVRAARALLFGLALTLGLSACGSDVPIEPVDPNIGDINERSYIDRQKYGTIHGNDGFALSRLFSSRSAEEGEAVGPSGAVGVNGFLWRASLETVEFMPLISTDPFGGVIVTDWYAPPETPNERFKMTVYVRDRALRADGLKVAVFRQLRAPEGWVEAPTDPATPRGIEDAILTKARQLRVAQLGE